MTSLSTCIWVARPKYAQGLPHNGYQMALDLKKKFLRLRLLIVGFL